MAISAEARKKEEARYALLIAQAKERIALARQNIPPPPISISSSSLPTSSLEKVFDKPSSFPAQRTSVENVVSIHAQREAPKTENLIWDKEQQRAIDLVSEGKSICIIGAAGYGKTTVAREAIRRKIQLGKIPPLQRSTKYLSAGLPGVCVLSFTNKAVANIRRGMPKDITCITAHKLLEYSPVFYEVQNADGEWTKTMRFEPARNVYNKLPSSLTTIVFEESSTISTELFQKIIDALPSPESVQFIFLGDIQQLPPIYGPAILGFKMLELPVIELQTPYRQADESPILAFAWELLKGVPLSPDDIKKRFNTEGKFEFNVWKQRREDHYRLKEINVFVRHFLKKGFYNPLEDMILMPFNVSVGTIAVNKSIADYLGKERNAEVHEVIAGFRKFYYAIGDKVLVNKQEAIIERISRNALFSGKEPLSPSTKLNRWGHYELESKADVEEFEKGQMSLEELEGLLAAATTDSGEIEERKNQASHILHCRLLDSDEEIDVQTTGDFNECLFAYVLTVHKAQGSEWKRVFIFLDFSHATMISRELLYTAVTRARESLYIFCEPEHFRKGILQQRIPGNTLAEKAEVFKGKLLKQSEEDGE